MSSYSYYCGIPEFLRPEVFFLLICIFHEVFVYVFCCFIFFLERGRGSVYQGQAGLPTAFANDRRVFQSSWHGQVISLVAQGRAACEVGSVVLFIILKFD